MSQPLSIRHDVLACAALIRQQVIGDLAMLFGIDAIDALYRDREHAVFGRPYPAFFLQIPKMKLQMLSRTT